MGDDYARTRQFECQIRDTTQHESHQMDSEAGATVLLDELHPNDYHRHKQSGIRVYIEDNHDQGFDVGIQHTHRDDADFTAAVTEGTITLAAGADSGTLRIDGPVGRLQFVTQTGALTTAPADGSLSVYVY